MWGREAMRDELLWRLEPVRRAIAVARAALSMELLRPKLAARGADELAFLPAVTEIIETPASPAGRLTGLAIMALIASGLAWAVLGQVDIHATAQGRIIPGGRTKPVAPPETATVSEILVKDGDHVREGQVLVVLDATNPQADAQRLEREQQEQQVIAARLRALLDGKSEIALDPQISAPKELVAIHQAQLRQKEADQRATIEGLRRELEQKEATARGVEAEVQRLAQTVPLLEERAGAKETLAAQGFGRRDDYLATKQEYLDRKQQLETARFNLKDAQAAIGNVKERLAQSDAQFRGEALAQLADADQKAASLEQEHAKALQRSRLYNLTAPVDGVVQQLAINAPGAVVSQAMPVLLVVPDTEGIAVEAALQNKDVGFVRPGQSVEIKVESFPFTRYGTIPGEVAFVSSDAVQNADADPTQRTAASIAARSLAGEQGALYAVRILLSRGQIHADGRDVPLTPGMAVTAEIKTGRRRVIDYVLDPVLRYQDESLRER